MRTLTTIILIISVTIITGCRNTSKPVDLPKLYPCTITITQEGVPLAGAMIELLPADGSSVKYRAVTVTGKDGKAAMATYRHSGVPVGKYKVIVDKDVEEGDVKPVIYRLVEKKFSSAETTPYEIEITGKGRVEKTFDVGKAVKVR
ncbi:MAG: carboxypeptidase-like regulatory domain-containing protein [Planctomycetaceae bacterium]|jgi:5-hydroxyisourate hydrolase-like protein (transthyretin family)|nr:carboxypeptidase-like regulatory domain-containing protein [Planctomycetaceae bacterium]